MDLQSQQPATPAEPVSQPVPLASELVRGYVSLPPEPVPAAFSRSPWFLIFALLMIGAAAVAGAVKSGKIHMFFNQPKTAAAANTAVAAPPAVPALKPGVFVVTAISMGQPSIAIINGKSRVEGDPVEAPGVTGWRVKQIVDGAVWLQNGTTFSAVPLAAPTLKPLNDTLKPLN